MTTLLASLFLVRPALSLTPGALVQSLAGPRFLVDSGPDPRALIRGDAPSVYAGASNGREIWFSPETLRAGLEISGPSPHAINLSLALASQWIASGSALVLCTPDASALNSIKKVAHAIGRQNDVLIIDPVKEMTGSFNPLADLPAESILRLLFAIAPGLADEHAVGAETIAARCLRATVAAMSVLRDHKMIDLTPTELRDNLPLRKFIDLTDPEKYPMMPYGIRKELNAYLSALPSFQPEKGYRQSQATQTTHQDALNILEQVFWPLWRTANTVNQRNRFSVRDVVDGRRILGVLLPEGNSKPETVALDYVHATVSEIGRLDRLRPAKDAILFAIDDRSESTNNSPYLLRGSARVQTSEKMALPPRSTQIQLEGGFGQRIFTSKGVSPFSPVHFRTLKSDVRMPLRLHLQQYRTEDLISGSTLPEILERLASREFSAQVVEDADRAVEDLTSGRDIAKDDILRRAAILSSKLADPKYNLDDKERASAILARIALSGQVETSETALESDMTTAGKEYEDAIVRALLDDLEKTAFEEKRKNPAKTSNFQRVRRPVEPQTVGETESLVVVPASYTGRTRGDEGGDRTRSTRISDNFDALAGLPLPYRRTPDVAIAAKSLSAEFPHLADVIDRILTEVSDHRVVRMRPIVFHGPPGSGKTRFARKLAKTLGVESVVYPCGGSSDSSIGGTSRQWNSGRASVPLQTIARTRTPNPCVILDEVESARS